jgi:hypothetical protein
MSHRYFYSQGTQLRLGTQTHRQRFLDFYYEPHLGPKLQIHHQNRPKLTAK